MITTDFKPNFKYVEEVSKSVFKTTVQGYSLAQTLSPRTREDRKKFLSICTQKTKLQNWYNPHSKSDKFTDSQYSYIFYYSFCHFTELFMFPHEPLPDFGIKLAKLLKLENSTSLLQKFFLPAVMGASLAYSTKKFLASSTSASMSSDELKTVVKQICTTLDIKFESHLVSFFVSLTWILLRDGYFYPDTLETILSLNSHYENSFFFDSLTDFWSVMVQDEVSLADLDFDSCVSKEDSTQLDYVVLYCLYLIGHSMSFSSKSKRPKAYLKKVVDSETLPLEMVLGAYSFMTALSAHEYKLFFKLLGKDTKTIPAVEAIYRRYFKVLR